MAALVIVNNILVVNSAEQFGQVMDLFHIPSLVSLVTATSKPVQEQALWVLDNVVQDKGQFRHKVLLAGIIPKITEVQTDCFLLQHFRLTVFFFIMVIQAIERDQPSRDFAHRAAELLEHITVDDGVDPIAFGQQITKLIPALNELLAVRLGVQTNTFACSTMVNLLRHKSQSSQIVTHLFSCPNLVSRLVQMAKIDDGTRQPFAVSVLNNMCATGTANHLRALVRDVALLPVLSHLMSHQNISVATLSCEVMSRFCNDSASMLQAVLDSGLIAKAVSATHSNVEDIRLLSMRALMNALNCCDEKQSDALIELGCLDCVFSVFKNDALQAVPKAAMRCVLGLAKKLKHLDNFKRMCDRIKTVGGEEDMRLLAAHSDKDVADVAQQIILLTAGDSTVQA